MRFWQMIDEGLVKIRQQKERKPGRFSAKLPTVSIANARRFGQLLAVSPSMLAILPKRNYSSNVVKPILAFASRVIQ